MGLGIHNLCIHVDGFDSFGSNKKKIDIVKNASFTAPLNQITTIIGANGVGKSTLLKAIVGDIDISSGEISLHQEVINPKVTNQQRARGLAFLPQLSLLNFPYTVEEVVGLGRIPHETGEKIDSIVIQESLVAVEMEKFSQRLYPQLSGGEKQRVQIARVLAQIWRAENSASARVLLLDEPNSSLDLGHQQMLMSFLQQFAKQNVAILMVLHNLNTASNYSDQLVAMNQGKVVAIGSPEEIIQADLISELFNVECKIISSPITDKPIVLEGSSQITI